MITYYPLLARYWIMPLLLALLLSGCASNPEYDTLATVNTGTEIYSNTGTDVYSGDNTNSPTGLVPQVITDPLARNPDKLAVHTTQDLWERVRLGFRLNIADDWRVRQQLSWIAANPDSLELNARRAEPYLHFIVEEAEKRNMPLELALLPVVESGFRPLARSRSAALGLWQFIPSTGKEKGLESNWWYEGRCDVMASTRAALDYLQELADKFGGDWELALAAYNAGPGRVQRAITANENKGLATDFWSISLPEETRNYVPKLLAIAQALKDPEYYGINLNPLANAPFFRPVDLPGPLPLRQAASLANVDQSLINALNPGLRRGVAGIGGDYPLLLPVEQADRFEARLASMAPQRWTRLHHYKVQPGDTLTGIARQFGISGSALEAVNGLAQPSLHSGQGLVVPVVKNTESNAQNTTARIAKAPTTRPLENKPNTVTNTNSSNTDTEPQHRVVAALPNNNATAPIMDNTIQGLEGRTHRVKAREYLTSIARAYGVSPTQLAAWNNLSPQAELYKGQVLRLYSMNDVAEAKAISYKVQKGDSLRQIAQRFNVSIPNLRRWNRLYGDTIIPGRRIKVRVNAPMTSSVVR